jgi:hypothetical protein
MKRFLLDALSLLSVFVLFLCMYAATVAPEWAKLWRWVYCGPRECRYPQGYYTYSQLEWVIGAVVAVLIFLIIRLYIYDQGQPKRKNIEKIKNEAEYEKPKCEFDLAGSLTDEGEAHGDALQEFEQEMAGENLPSLDELI